MPRHQQEFNPHQYPPESAARLLTTNVPTVSEQALVGDIERLLTAQAGVFDSIDYIYVLSSSGELRGVVSVREVFRQKSEVPISEIMSPAAVTVRPHTDQERVALLALKHSLKAVPVVDKDNYFIGSVLHDVILKTLDKEAVEDILRLGGVYQSRTEFVRYDQVLELPIMMSLKHRLPWLLLGLGGGLVAAGIITSFESTLSKNLILASFIPLVVYISDAVGTQMEAFIIRDLAVSPNLRFGRYFIRQLAVIALLGVIISVLLYTVSFILYGQLRLSLILSLSLFIAVLSSLFTGLIIPYLFSRLKQDPANASGPVATIIQDIISVAVYFAVAQLLM